MSGDVTDYFTVQHLLMGAVMGMVMVSGSLFIAALLRGPAAVLRLFVCNLQFDSGYQHLSPGNTEGPMVWVLRFIAAKGMQRNRRRAFVTAEVAGGTEQPYLVFEPAGGISFFKYQGRWMWMNRTRQLTEQGQVNDTLSIECFGWNGLTALENFAEDARQFNIVSRRGHVTVLTSSHGSWAISTHFKPRLIDSLCLGDNLAIKLMDDLTDFQASEEWYISRGIPYRRGYLLFGPPGTGKTSVIKVLTGLMGYSLCLLDLASEGMSDASLTNLLNAAPAKSAFLIEDIDHIMTKLETSSSNTLTVSGMLNALDGVASQEGNIFFFTSNDPKSLPAALFRHGRIDVRCCLSWLDAEQAKIFLDGFYRGVIRDADVKALDMLKDAAADAAGKFYITPAALQGYLLHHKHSVVDAQKTFPHFCASCTLRSAKADKYDDMYADTLNQKARSSSDIIQGDKQSLSTLPSVMSTTPMKTRFFQISPSKEEQNDDGNPERSLLGNVTQTKPPPTRYLV